MRLDLIDEFRLDLYLYVAGEGIRLFDEVPKSYRLDLVSSTGFSNGTVGLHYRPAPLTQRLCHRRNGLRLRLRCSGTQYASGCCRKASSL